MDRTRGSVLELGCGNGNNLRLFRDFGWRTVGIDNSSNALADALGNFGAENASECEFHEWDLGEGLPDLLEEFDVMLMPNVAYYLKRQAFANLLSECRGVLKGGGSYMISCRSIGDWRFGRGQQVGENAFIMTTNVTGELGTLQTFYDSTEVVALVESRMGTTDKPLVLHYDYENLQCGKVIDNHDFVIWGRIG